VSAPEVLYHFTCADGHRAIGEHKPVLRPQTRLWPFIWLTTEAVPDFEATGLLSVTLTCDRTEHRYRVTRTALCVPWLGSQQRSAVDPDFLNLLEQFGDPEHWWLSPGPVRAEWDESWQRERVS